MAGKKKQQTAAQQTVTDVAVQSQQNATDTPAQIKSKGKGKHSGPRENPPFYVALGLDAHSGQQKILWTWPTIGQATKGIGQVRNGFGGVYSSIRIARMKIVEG